MNVSLTPELESLVRDKLDSGLYHSASEVIREALRLLKQRDENYSARLESLRREIALGLDDVDKGNLAAVGMEAIIRKARSGHSRKK